MYHPKLEQNIISQLECSLQNWIRFDELAILPGMEYPVDLD